MRLEQLIEQLEEAASQAPPTKLTRMLGKYKMGEFGAAYYSGAVSKTSGDPLLIIWSPERPKEVSLRKQSELGFGQITFVKDWAKELSALVKRAPRR